MYAYEPRTWAVSMAQHPRVDGAIRLVGQPTVATGFLGSWHESARQTDVFVTDIEVAADRAHLPFGSGRITVVRNRVSQPASPLVEVVSGTDVGSSSGVIMIPREKGRILEGRHHHLVQQDLAGQSG
jgi:hypothetical protein